MSLPNNAAWPPTGSPKLFSSSSRSLRVALSEQIFLLAAEHQFVLLVVHCHRNCHHAGRALWGQRRDYEARIERIAGIDRLQEFARLLDEGDQRVADHMCEGAGTRCSEAQHLKAVREWARMTAFATIFDVVMDRVVIARDGPERREIGFGHGAARDVEPLADYEILEILALRKPVLAPVERFTHAARCALIRSAISGLSLCRAIFKS